MSTTGIAASPPPGPPGIMIEAIRDRAARSGQPQGRAMALPCVRGVGSGPPNENRQMIADVGERHDVSIGLIPKRQLVPPQYEPTRVRRQVMREDGRPTMPRRKGFPAQTTPPVERSQPHVERSQPHVEPPCGPSVGRGLLQAGSRSAVRARCRGRLDGRRCDPELLEALRGHLAQLNGAVLVRRDRLDRAPVGDARRDAVPGGRGWIPGHGGPPFLRPREKPSAAPGVCDTTNVNFRTELFTRERCPKYSVSYYFFYSSNDSRPTRPRAAGGPHSVLPEPAGWRDAGRSRNRPTLAAIRAPARGSPTSGPLPAAGCVSRPGRPRGPADR